MITVLCSSCNAPLLTTTPERLGWPMQGNMFSCLIPNWTLRDMPLYLEYYCPVCQNYPFYADGSGNGYKGVGRYLNVQVEGKPKMMSVEAIKGLPDVPCPRAVEVVKGKQGVEQERVVKWPCPSCGAKRTFHRKGCSTQPNQSPDAFIDTLERRVKKGGFNEDVNQPPTPEEIAELGRDREARGNGRSESQLRPMK